jgi:hypothetical protein
MDNDNHREQELFVLAMKIKEWVKEKLSPKYSNYKRVSGIILGIWLITLIAVMGYIGDGIWLPDEWLAWVALLLFAETAGLIAVGFLYYRCPSCKGWLGRGGGLTYCPHCAKKIEK